MTISLGFIKSSSQIILKDYSLELNQVENKIVDVVDLVDLNLQGLYIDGNEHFSQLSTLLEKEKEFYPILDANDFKLTANAFENLNAFDTKELYDRTNSRWLIIQNMNAVENLVSTSLHLKELWNKDRITFFEELWYWMKRNLAPLDLTLIFHDVLQTEDEEKKDRPKLVTSVISGTKKGNFSHGGAKEQELMHLYQDTIVGPFEVTEFDSKKARFVAVAKISMSPIIIMGHVTQLSSLQKSLLSGLFKALSAK